MHTPYPDVIIFGSQTLIPGSMYTFTHALLADPLAPLLAQMQLKVDPAGAPSAGGRSYLCVWRLIGSSLFLEQVLRPDLSGGEVLFGQDYFATPPADAAFFTAPEAELRKIRAWLCGKRRRWNREPLWLPATWVPDPIELVLACKGAELGVERADLSKPDPLHVRSPGDDGQFLQFPAGGPPVYQPYKPCLRDHIDGVTQWIDMEILDPARTAIRKRVRRFLTEEQSYV